MKNTGRQRDHEHAHQQVAAGEEDAAGDEGEHEGARDVVPSVEFTDTLSFSMSLRTS